MCEIVVLPAGDASDANIQHTIRVANDLYDSNPHGLGVVAVERDDNGRFSYRSIKTGWTSGGIKTSAVRRFLRQQLDDAWRIILHARFKTHGAIGAEGTHPISVRGCDEEPWQYVVHNGVVRNASVKQRTQEKNGHSYNTEVDSEAIAHTIPVPGDDFGDEDSEWDTPTLTGNLNYLLLSHDGILVYTDGKYTVTSDFTMTCQLEAYHSVDEDNSPGERGHFYVTPDGNVEFEADERTTYSGRSGSSTVRSGGVRSTGWTYGSAGPGSNSDSGSRGSSTSTSTGTSDAAETANSTAGEHNAGETHIVRGDAFDGTRGTDFYKNPSPSDSEAHPHDTHEGIFAGADTLFCLEHGNEFTMVCGECEEMDIDLSLIAIYEEPWVIGKNPYHGAIQAKDGENLVVKRCPRSLDIWYAGDECPICGQAHHDTDEPTAGMAGWGGR